MTRDLVRHLALKLRWGITGQPGGIRLFWPFMADRKLLTILIKVFSAARRKAGTVRRSVKKTENYFALYSATYDLCLLFYKISLRSWQLQGE